jgi:hypothetical protein
VAFNLDDFSEHLAEKDGLVVSTKSIAASCQPAILFLYYSMNDKGTAFEAQHETPRPYLGRFRALY